VVAKEITTLYESAQTAAEIGKKIAMLLMEGISHNLTLLHPSLLAI